MSKQRNRRHPRPTARQPQQAAPSFTPVPVRPRHDGWTPAKQVAFVEALAATACIEEACRAVGMSPRAFYDLRARPDAGSFRTAVEAALDLGTHRIADAMMGRALNGEVTPIFYKGEQIGERRRYDNRLGMFILRTRMPDRYGKWRDNLQQYREDPDGAAGIYARAVRRLAEDAAADAGGVPRALRAPLPLVQRVEQPRYTPPPPVEIDPVELDRLERLAAQYASAPVPPDDVSRSS